MEELSREEVVVLAEKAGFGMNEIRKDIVKFERLAWLVSRVFEEEADAVLPRVQ
jgi:hypothetical protein